MARMKNATAALVAALALAAALPVVTQARPRTTTPGVIYLLHTRVDDTGIHVPKDQFTKNGITRYPRGALIRYEFTNKGTKPYAVHVWGAETVVMKANGGHATMLVNWQYRGEYHYWRVLRGKRLTPVGTVVIF
jgi:hypothetical protein